MRKLFYCLLVPALFACQEKDLTTENPAPEPDNISIQTSFVYDTSTFKLDSIYTNNWGEEFFFQEVSLVFSNFNFVEKEDTVLSLPEPFLVSAGNPINLIGVIPPGGYSGKYLLQLGLDSIQGLNFTSAQANDEALKQSSVFRADGLGIDQIVMKGKLFDPTDPLDSVGKIPFEYRIGTPITVKNYSSDVNNFSVSGNPKIPFILYVDLWPVFKDFSLYDRPTITSNPQNLFDIEAAQGMADSLQVSLF